MKWDFVNIEKSVQELYVPNLPGVQPRRRFFLVGGGRWEVGGGPLFGSLNLLIIIQYIVKVYIYMYAKGIHAQQKSYGF